MPPARSVISITSIPSAAAAIPTGLGRLFARYARQHLLPDAWLFALHRRPGGAARQRCKVLSRRHSGPILAADLGSLGFLLQCGVWFCQWLRRQASSILQEFLCRRR